MQELIEIPDYLEELHREAQALAAELAGRLEPLGKRDWTAAKVDFLALDPPCVHFIHDGFLKYLHDDKIVRIYYSGDLLPPQTSLPSGESRLFGEFGTETTAVPVDAFERALAAEPALLSKWNRFVALDGRILHVLCALHMHVTARPKIVVRHFKEGDLIIRQGERPDAIYLMIEGEAEAKVGEVAVGRIAANEIFGEISFLTDKERTADVRALSRCLVQSIDEEEFLRLIRVKPQLAVDVARTLARRVMDMNSRVVGANVT